MAMYFNPVNVNSVSVKSLNVFYVFVDHVLFIYTRWKTKIAS